MDNANEPRNSQPARSEGNTSASTAAGAEPNHPHLGTYPNGRNTDSSGAGRWQEGQNGHQMFGTPSATSDESSRETPESSRH